MIYPNGTTYPFKTSATLYAIWVTNPSPLTVTGTPTTAAVGTTIALTSSGGSAGAVTYSTTSNGCTVSSKSLTATAVGTCVVTATLRTETATATFTFTAATVTFNANGGEKTMVSQAATRLTALKANEFTKSGYVFDGWATTSTGDKAYGNGDDYKFDKSVTLYARWVVAPSSTVTFNANGGTETMENQTANMSTPLKENVFKRSGYVFDGWSTTVNGDKAYGNGDNYTFGESATLYARWAAVPSTVVTQAATVPGAPELTALSRRSKTEVWVTFSAPSSTGGAPITGYTVTATRNGVDVTQSFPAEAGRVSVGPLTRYAVYTFTVRAVNSVGTSEPSNASRFTVG